MIERCDVCVVGGGPAGTSTALFLACVEGIAAERVLLLEKARHPREKPCGGAVSAWGVEALARVGVSLASIDALPMRGLRIVDRGGAVAGEHVADAAHPLGVVVRRDELDAMLWRRAVAEGVRGVEGEAVRAMRRTAGGWRLETAEGRVVDARFVAACDGAGSTVRKLLGVAEPARKGHALVLETPLRADLDGALCDFDLSVAADVDGYTWDFPCMMHGSAHVSRGIYHANVHPYRELKALLVRELARRGLSASDTPRPKPFSVRPFVRETTLVLPDLLLVGEAAGIDATTGEGIAQAILFGEMAARHLARALRLGSWALGDYAREVFGSRMGRHLLQSAWLVRHVYGARGAPFRSLLVRSAAARAAGAAWYHGEKLGWPTLLRLGASLAREATRPH